MKRLHRSKAHKFTEYTCLERKSKVYERNTDRFYN